MAKASLAVRRVARKGYEQAKKSALGAGKRFAAMAAGAKVGAKVGGAKRMAKMAAEGRRK